MARPTKCRRVCHFPETLEFVPMGQDHAETVVLSIDEFEAIRLIDREGLSQEACGAQLGVGRTTAQKIYDTARKKIAEALVSGMTLKIEGGDFRLCSGESDFCYKKDCFKRQDKEQYQMEKGDQVMRIAVTYENGTIFQHFGRTAEFKVYDVADGKIVKSEVVSTNGSGHGALAGILFAMRVDALICGGIGGGAQMALRDMGIDFYGGVSGNADDAVNALIAGNLRYDPNVHCDHHDHEHGEEGHTCGDHGCGQHGCGNH